MSMAQIRAAGGVAFFALAWLIHDTVLTPFSHALSRVFGWRQPVDGELLLPNYMLTCGLRVVFWLAWAALLFRVIGHGNPAFRLDSRRAPRQFAQGFAVATAILVGIALLFVVTGGASFGVQPHPPLALAGYAASWLVGELLLGTAEELAFRGILLWLLVPLVGTRGAVLLSAVAFSAAHYAVADGQAVFFGYVVIQGLILGQSVVRTGGLAWAIGYHAAWDWVMGEVLGMTVGSYSADTGVLAYRAVGPAWLTGGAVGPEASVVLLAALIVVVALAFRRGRSPEEVG